MPDEKPKLSFEDLLELERGSFFVHADGSVFTMQGKYIFQENEANYIRENMMKGFRAQIKEANERQLKEIKKALLNFGMFPMRYH